MNEKPIKRFLPVPLTISEQVEYGKKLAQLHEQYSEVEYEKKAAADVFKDRLETIDGQVTSLSRIVRSGEERRDVECLWHYMFATNVKELVRMDTGEIVETGAISAEERQLLLQVEQDNEAAAATSDETREAK